MKLEILLAFTLFVVGCYSQATSFPCDGNSCGPDEKCVAEPKQCVTTPCPQYRCDKSDDMTTGCALFKCGGDTCPNGYAIDQETGCQDGCTCAAATECKRNEKLYECGACDNTCALVRAGDGLACTADCRAPECGCLPGYARNDKGRCVSESVCKRDETLCESNDCKENERCVPARKECKKPPCPQYICKPRKTRPSKAPRCRKTEELFQCGACDNTCAQVREGEAMACTEECRAPECGCKKGYARDEKNRCVSEKVCKIPEEVRQNRQECRQKPEVGMCRAAIPSFYYDPNSKACKTFSYGGCGGNANRFETEEACMEKCGPNKALRCRKSEVLAPCGACDQTCAQVRDGETALCTKECRAPACSCKKGYARDQNKRCVPEKFCKKPEDVRQRRQDCRQKPEVGDCKAAIPSFYYEPKSKTCKTFSYGGCGGNANRFETEEACMEKCGPKNKPDNSVDVCRQPKVVGQCEADIQSWFYNADSGQCEAFSYGGCDGNDNRFDSLADCQKRCPPRKG